MGAGPDRLAATSDIQTDDVAGGSGSLLLVLSHGPLHERQRSSEQAARLDLLVPVFDLLSDLFEGCAVLGQEHRVGAVLVEDIAALALAPRAIPQPPTYFHARLRPARSQARRASITTPPARA